MRQLSLAVVNFLKREDGPTAVEYAVMLSLIIVVCLVAAAVLSVATGLVAMRRGVRALEDLG